MLRFWVLVICIACAAAIKVPIQEKNDPSEDVPIKEESPDEKLINISAADRKQELNVDSYHPIPETDQTEETKDSTVNDKMPAPARYLQPPLQDAESHYYVSTEAQPIQGGWTPIMVQALPRLKHSIVFNPNTADQAGEAQFTADAIKLEDTEQLPKATSQYTFNTKLTESNLPRQFSQQNVNVPFTPPFVTKSDPSAVPIIIPSTLLQPPLPYSLPNTNFRVPAPASELQVPLFKPTGNFQENLNQNPPVVFLDPVYPTLALHLKPPKPEQIVKLKKPTNVYPKKYIKSIEVKPIAIPVQEFSEEIKQELPKPSPIKQFKPILKVENDYVLPLDDKTTTQHEQREDKGGSQEEEQAIKQQEFVDKKVSETFAPSAEAEQDASETGFYGGPSNTFAAPAGPAPPVSDEVGPGGAGVAEGLAPAERTEFRMHGLHGPHSYKFGYDTGKGKNRQFRYEERSNDGYVRGHYGYMDRHGKLQVVNYDAHPEHGFHAEGPFGKV